MMMTKCKKKTQNNVETACLVCSGPAIGINFGVLTCAPCKAFFRRNAVKLGIHEFRCAADGDCPVTSDTRRQCNCCRLARCFRVGMNRAAIRTEDQRLERQRLIEYNRRLRTASREEVTAEKDVSTNADKQITTPPVTLLRLGHSDSMSVVPSDQVLLTNIFGVYEQTCIQSSCAPHIETGKNEQLTLETFMNSYSPVYMALIKYVKFVPEFVCLPIDSQVSLIKSNLNHILRINNATVVQATSSVVQNVKPLAFMRLFPFDLFMEMVKCIRELFPLTYDPILLKLFIIVLTFSTRLSTRYEMRMAANADNIDPRIVVAAQNTYIELLWRYILSRCSSYRQAIQTVTSLVTRLLYSQLVQKQMEAHIDAHASHAVDQLSPLVRLLWVTDKET